MEILGFICALLIGLSLGLIGGGGSILTVPVLVYLLGINPVLATAYSLFIVGTTAAVGAIGKFRMGLVEVRTTLVFAVPSLLGVYFTRSLVVPALPDQIAKVSDLVLTKDLLIMLVFSILMLLAAVSMIRKKNRNDEGKKGFNYTMITLEGLGVGLATGFVGAGGGFLIIPALVLLAGLSMKMAVGTSLSIIAIKSLIGFLGDLQAGQQIDWLFLLGFTSLAVLGIFVGNYTSQFFSDGKLKTWFGWFILLMGFYILTKELIIG